MNRILRLTTIIAFVSVFSLNLFIEDSYSVPTLNIFDIYSPAGTNAGPVTVL